MENYFQKLYSKHKDDFYKLVRENMLNNIKMFIVTANPETFIWAKKDLEVNDLLLDKNVTVIPDGISIVRAAKILKYSVKERITGIDLAEYLLDEANKKHLNVAFLGATSEVQTLLKKRINEVYPNIKIVAAKDGFTTDRDEFFQDLTKKDADIILVALGIPNQEKIIYKHFKNFKKGIFVGVGGSLDVISGLKKRSPKIFIKLHLEWFYRLIKEPNRFGRFYENNIKFMFKIIKLRFSNKNK